MLLDLVRRYQEPHRKYHNLLHIAQIFNTAKELGVHLTDNQMYAVWFHDAVYDTQGLDNEEKSAELAGKHLSFLPEKDRNQVQTMIMDTKKHEASIPESRLVLDLDVSILGSERDAYNKYMTSVREEFSFVPYDVYKEGRAKVLEKFLSRAKDKTLYYDLEEAFTGRAISNMEYEKSLLG